MNDLEKRRWSLIAFPLAGFLSALFLVLVDSRFAGPRSSPILFGAMFGAVNAVCLYSFAGVQSFWKLAFFIVASLAALSASMLAAAWTFTHLTSFLDDYRARTSPGGPETFFVGGFVGAVILVAAVSLSLSPRSTILKSLFKALGGGLAGGLFAVAGEASGPLFYRVLSRVPSLKIHGDYSDIALTVIWQTGMAFVLGLFLYFERKTSLPNDPSGVRPQRL